MNAFSRYGLALAAHAPVLKIEQLGFKTPGSSHSKQDDQKIKRPPIVGAKLLS